MHGRRRVRAPRGVALACATLLIAACGGGGGGDDGTVGAAGGGGSGPTGGDPASSGGGASGAPQFITETQVEVPASTRVALIDDPQGRSQEDLSAATYMIRLFWVDGNGRRFNQLLGSGFGIGGNLIATNAHVTGEVLNRSRQFARSGVRLERASALRDGTDDEIPLLEVLAHPSYNNSTRSPDIGLFVARESLPVALTLATDAEVGAVRSGDAIVLNGFPGNVDDLIFADGFGDLSIPRATLFSSNVQSLQKFDERSVIDQNDPLDIDMFQHGADTAGGTSGSPILKDGKVIAVHNSGLQYSTLAVLPNGTVSSMTDAQATASWGVHVKHLKNLLAEYRTGVMEADKRFRIPVPQELLQVPAGQQSTDGPAIGGGSVARFAGDFDATVTLAENPDSTHRIDVAIDTDGSISGTSSWPANSSGGARSFTLSGSIDEDGLFEIRDDTPEQFPGFRRGLYRGNVNAASGEIDGRRVLRAERGDRRAVLLRHLRRHAALGGRGEAAAGTPPHPHQSPGARARRDRTGAAPVQSVMPEPIQRPEPSPSETGSSRVAETPAAFGS